MVELPLRYDLAGRCRERSSISAKPATKTRSPQEHKPDIHHEKKPPQCKRHLCAVASQASERSDRASSPIYASPRNIDWQRVSIEVCVRVNECDNAAPERTEVNRSDIGCIS